MRRYLPIVERGTSRGGATESTVESGSTRVGTVVARADDGRCGVRFAEAEASTVWALPTADCDAQAGERVLVTFTECGDAYVLARIGRPRESRMVETSSGARAELVGDAGDEKLRVRRPDGALLFEYAVESGRSAVYVPEGDLALHAPHGRIELAAEEGIQCASPGPIQLQSAVHVGLSTRAEEGETAARLSLTGEHLGLAGGRISALARRAELRIERLGFKGERVDATLERARLVVEKLDTIARRVFERIGRATRHVEETDQRRAGRVVDRIDGAHHVSSGESTVRARGTYRLDGEQIHLG